MTKYDDLPAELKITVDIGCIGVVAAVERGDKDAISDILTQLAVCAMLYERKFNKKDQ